MNLKAYIVFFCSASRYHETRMWKLDGAKSPWAVACAILAGVLPATDPEELCPECFKYESNIRLLPLPWETGP